jgi:hypothetical protein
MPGMRFTRAGKTILALAVALVALILFVPAVEYYAVAALALLVGVLAADGTQVRGLDAWIDPRRYEVPRPRKRRKWRDPPRVPASREVIAEEVRPPRERRDRDPLEDLVS